MPALSPETFLSTRRNPEEGGCQTGWVTLITMSGSVRFDICQVCDQLLKALKWQAWWNWVWNSCSVPEQKGRFLFKHAGTTSNLSPLSPHQTESVSGQRVHLRSLPSDRFLSAWKAEGGVEMLLHLFSRILFGHGCLEILREGCMTLKPLASTTDWIWSIMLMYFPCIQTCPPDYHILC